MRSEIKEMENFKDFKRVYEVFSRPPYNEKITCEDLSEIYEDYKTNGVIYGAYNRAGEAIGLIVLTEGSKKGHPNFGDEKIMYLADIAVLEEYRKSGLGTQLMVQGVMMGMAKGFSRMYMRTLPKGESMSYGIANNVGFTKIPDFVQMVQRVRMDGTVEQEKSIFLDIDLRNLNKETLKRAIQGSVKTSRKLDDEEVSL